uniref:uncharacterized protein LOC127067705 isoform X2 n=1 Tax=Vespula vulgaris TaxID=7454 RepID=UPI00214025D6|nr:uncharacterized protein LOC127067705 isoform X2 [Vespula vulgaris]XP_050858921.1 uncharacterized protein LOC127067705 isoform X2 [Vespula vulgaris]
MEFVELFEVHKYIRSYKFYNPKSRGRSRWISRSPKYYGAKKSTKNHYYSRPGYPRYAPLYEESSVSDNQPYTIIIQLPKREEKRRNRYYEKYYDRDDAHDREYTGNEHYNDHDEDFGSRAFHIGEKKVQIKVTEDAGSKVHIKVSRIDDDKGIEIADKNNTTVLTTPIFLSSKLLPTHTAETNLLTFKPPLFFQRHIQGI